MSQSDAVNMSRDAPRAIMVYIESCVFVRGDACTKEELRALRFNEDRIVSADLLKRNDFETKAQSDEFVDRALALGFEFCTRHARGREEGREEHHLRHAPSPGAARICAK
jgi:hypothetical protein